MTLLQGINLTMTPPESVVGLPLQRVHTTGSISVSNSEGYELSPIHSERAAISKWDGKRRATNGVVASGEYLDS